MSTDFIDTNASYIETPTKRPKKAIVKLPKYIDRFDGKGFYLRFNIPAKNIEEVSNIVDSLYKDRIIDNSFVHVYSRTKGTGEAFVVAHGIFHVVSRDFDFNFFRKRLSGGSFKLSTYPDREYNFTTKKEVLLSGSV